MRLALGRKIRRADDGAAAVEMALALPVLITMIYGIFTFGQFFEAAAGMQHALGEGARYGNLCLGVTNGACTLPTAKQIQDKVTSKLFGGGNGTFDTPSVDTSTANSGGYVKVTVGYHQTLSFLFFTGPTVNLSQSKRIYLASTPPSSGDCSGAASSTASCSIYTTT